MTLTFIETGGFTKSLDDFFATDDEYRRFQNFLLADPTRGDVIQGTGSSLRKVRWADPQRGKGTRGGIRVVYVYVPERQTIIFLRAYNKDKQDDLTPEQRKRFAQVAEAIRQEVLKP